MKSRILFLLLVLFSVDGFAQDSIYQLKDYKYRTPGFKALAINFGFSGSLSDYKNLSSDDKSKSFYLAPAQISYWKVSSTDKRLHYSNISLQPWGNFSKTETGGREIKTSNFKSYFSWQRNDRLYKNNLWFFEFGNQLDAELSNDKRKEQTIDNKSNNLKVSNEFSVGFGKGRVELVQDAQMALYILNDLKAQGLLTAAITPETANAFAQLITDINNKRVFDFRRRRIYELTRIDSFLQSSGLVNKTDIRHFTTVNDNWSLAFNPYRKAGGSWYVRLKPGIGYSNSNFKEFFTGGTLAENSSDNFYLSLTPEIGIEKYIPVNLKWQHDLGASLAYVGRRNKNNLKFISPGSTLEYEYDSYNWEGRFTGFWGVGFFPSTRTRIGSNLLAQVSYGKDKSYLINSELNLFANYFISYRTYLSANGNFAYRYAKFSAGNNSGFNSGISMSFSHILF